MKSLFPSELPTFSTNIPQYDQILELTPNSYLSFMLAQNQSTMKLNSHFYYQHFPHLFVCLILMAKKKDSKP